MKAILIDSVNRTVKEVDHDNSLDTIYSLLNCDTITVVYLDNGDCIYVDDNGLLNNPQHFFELGNFYQPVAGNGLVVGTDDESGDTVDCVSTVEEITNDVIFMDVATVLTRSGNW